MDEQQRFGVGIWNLKERLKERVRERLRFSPRHQFQLQHHHHHHNYHQKQSRRASAKAAVATSLAVARVFKGNAVLARVAGVLVRGHWSSGSKKSSEHWRARATLQLATKPPFKSFVGNAGSKSVASTTGTLPITPATNRAPPAAGQLDVREAGRPSGAVTRDAAAAASVLSAHSMHVEVVGRPSVTAAAVSNNANNASMVAAATTIGALGRDNDTGREHRKLADVALVEEMSARETSMWMKAAQAFAVPVFGTLSRIFMHGFNQTEVFDAHKLTEAIGERPKGKPLITVCNHVASMDDPLILAALIPPDLLVHAWAMRWTLCATDRCFTNPIFSTFFQSAKVLPIVRGAGLEQKGVDVAIGKLNKGDWVHIFPEGSRSRDGGKTLGSMKRGISRLVLDARETPMVVPFIHRGMEEVIPVGQSVPAAGKKVAVLVGDPIPLDDLVQAYRTGRTTQAEVYRAVAARVGRRMNELKGELEIRLEHAAALKEEATDKLAGWTGVRESWELLDWQAQGMGLFDWEALLSGGREGSWSPAPPRQLVKNGTELGSQGMESAFLARQPLNCADSALRMRDDRMAPTSGMPLSTVSESSSTTIHARDTAQNALQRAHDQRQHTAGNRLMTRDGRGQKVDDLLKACASELPCEDELRLNEESPLRRSGASLRTADLEAANKSFSVLHRDDSGNIDDGRSQVEFEDDDTWFSELYEVDGYRWGRWSSSPRNQRGWDMRGFAARELFGRGNSILAQGLSRGFWRRCEEMNLECQEELQMFNQPTPVQRAWMRPNWGPLLEKAGVIYRDLREQKMYKKRNWRLIDFLRSDPAVGSLGLGSSSFPSPSKLSGGSEHFWRTD